MAIGVTVKIHVCQQTILSFISEENAEQKSITLALADRQMAN